MPSEAELYKLDLNMSHQGAKLGAKKLTNKQKGREGELCRCKASETPLLGFLWELLGSGTNIRQGVGRSVLDWQFSMSDVKRVLFCWHVG